MEKRQSGYFGHLLSALLGKRPDGAHDSAPMLVAGSPEARIASLEMDLRERDARIAAMQVEYEAMRRDGERSASGAAQAEQEQFAKRIASPLANLVALKALADSGKELNPQDALSLVGDLLHELRKTGLEQIGEVGEEAKFDSALHQRMSGTGVRPGVPVQIRLPGFRTGDKILLKAMVSTRTGDGASRD